MSGGEPGKPKGIFIAYLVANLLLPGFLLLDSFLFLRLSGVAATSGASDKLVAGFSLAWFVLGLAGLVTSRRRPQFLRLVRKPLMSFYVLLVVFVVFELFARVSLKRQSPYPGVWVPGTQLVTRADPTETPGVRGIKKFTVNEIGLRGPAFPRQGDTYKIVTVGGSATECLALDDSEEWPHLLMEELNARQKRRFVWVGNAGVSGHTTVQHRVVLESLPILSEADLGIFMVGANDLWTTLAAEGSSTKVEQEHYAALVSAYLRGTQSPRFPLYKRLRLFELVRDTVQAATRKFALASEEAEVDYNASRRKRAAAATVPLPDLQTGLKEYRERILALACLCQARGARCLFVTQPSMWRADLPLAAQRLLWFGWVGRWKSSKGYISVADAARAIDAYNNTLLEVCRSNGLQCYDLASRVPRDSSAFYDDFHFNEQGARIVSQFLADYLLSMPPFAGQAPSVSLRKRSE